MSEMFESILERVKRTGNGVGMIDDMITRNNDLRFWANLADTIKCARQGKGIKNLPDAVKHTRDHRMEEIPAEEWRLLPRKSLKRMTEH